MRAYFSKHNPMKNEAQRKRMSESNPMQNKEIALAVGKKRARKVIINEKEYDSVKAVCDAYNTAYQTVRNWCLKGINPLGEECRYADEEQVVFTGKRYKKGACKNIEYNGIVYEAAKDVADELGVTPTTITRWAQKGFSPDGIKCRYLDDDRECVYKKADPGEKSRRAIMVNGVVYASIKEAEASLGLHKGRLAPYLAKNRKNNAFVCEYVNQQPSQGNSDSSTLEGSTTNG